MTDKETRPDGAIASQLSAPIDAETDTIPVVSASMYSLEAHKRVGDDGEYIICTGVTDDPWPALTGCKRGQRPEDGGVPAREWPAGTPVYEVPWGGVVDILDEFPVPTEAMKGRPFAYRDAFGNVFNFNVVVKQDGTLGIDWVNEPPIDPEEALSFEAIPRISWVWPVGVAAGPDNSIYTTNLSDGVTGAMIAKFNALFVMQYGNVFGGSGGDIFAHVYTDGVSVYYTDWHSPTNRYKILSVPVGAGTPANIWQDFLGGVNPMSFRQPYGIVGDGAHLWVVDRALHRVVKLDWTTVGNLQHVWSVGNPHAWGEATRTIQSLVAFDGPVAIATDQRGESLFVANRFTDYLHVDGDTGLSNVGRMVTFSGFRVRAVAKDKNGLSWYYVALSPELSIWEIGQLKRMNENGDTTDWTVNLGSGSAHFVPQSIANDSASGSVWVVLDNHTIQKRAANTGALQATWGTAGVPSTADGGLSAPRTVAYFGGSGATAAGLYVSEVGANRVQKLNPSTGAFISKITGFGPGNTTPFEFLHSVAVDLIGYVYIGEWDDTNQRMRVHVYDRFHTWLETINVTTPMHPDSYGMEVTKNGDVWLADRNNNKLVRLVPTPYADVVDGRFNTPTAATIGPDNSTLYVLDAGNGRVVKLDKVTGAWLETLTFGVGNGDGQISGTSEGIAIDLDGNIIISERDNHRLSCFAQDGTFLWKYGSLGSGEGQFNSPRQINFSPNGTVLWIADYNNDRIVSLRQVASGGVELGYNAYDWDEEFIGGGTTSGAIGERGWTFAGNGSIAVQPSTSSNPGLVRLNTGGTAGNRHRLTLGPWILPQIDSMLFIFFPASNGTATSLHQRAGLSSTVSTLDTLAPADGVCVEYDPAVSVGFLSVVKFVGGVRTHVITAVPFIAAAPYLAEFTVTAPGEVTVRLLQLLPLGNGIEEEVICTGISQTVQFDACFAQRTGNGTAKVMDPDYWSGSFSGLSRA